MSMIREAKHDEQLSALLEEFWKNQRIDDVFFTKQTSDKILNSIIEPDLVNDDDSEDDGPLQARFFGVWRLAAAAVVLLIGFGAFYKFKLAKTKEQVTIVKAAVKDLPPGGNRALLTLADGSTIILDSAANGLLATQGATKISKKENGQLVYSSADNENDLPLNQINMLSTPKGGQYQIFLPDGSKVWLNALSSIKYPAAFAKDERMVEVTGEVFFEVQKDKSRPFKVRFGETEVEVLGTSFNVMAYKDDSISRTTLVEGSVSLTNKHINQRLKPGQQASVGASGKITTHMVDVEEAIAWKKGLFYFRDAGIPQIMRKVARWYDVEIRYEGTVPVRQCSGKIPMDVNISELLQMLNYMGVACRMEDSRVIVSTKQH
ncbi:FecR family protein [Dyadobacter sp. CY326]|uniref:FecR family protein n=1 Tax=Dyadobacter sp. CY326 TaxID=2907300 RepID=UPI001F39027D|nr:FecR domain-containing protein [Dyadobacter sp. CY326]MCE7067148.1 FecR domain-containing protein [Dyadobacter sp. CY326]